MNIGGYQPCSLCDYPGHVAAVVFAQGCNFRCPFCHNSALLPLRVDENRLIRETSILERLRARRGKIDAVVISGGEPAIQPDLAPFLRHIRRLGLRIKLDTNGSRPDVLSALLDARLLDYIAMDVKAPWNRYHELAGAPLDVTRVMESARLVGASGVAHEFRTTEVHALLSAKDMAEVRAQIPAGSSHRLQPFRSAYALDPRLRPVSKSVRVHGIAGCPGRSLRKLPAGLRRGPSETQSGMDGASDWLRP